MRRGRVTGSLVSPAVKRELARRYTAGEDSKALAAEFGVNRDTIRCWVRETGGAVRTRQQARALRDGSVAERFDAKYSVLPNGCWQWTGALNEDGYGLFRSPEESKAHRYSYRRFKGPIPAGLEPDHTCNYRACVNPDHLEAVTHKINVQRAFQRAREAA